MYDHTESTEWGRKFKNKKPKKKKKFKPHVAYKLRHSPQGVDCNIMSFFICCCEHLKKLQQHSWQEVDDDMRLHGM